MNVTSTETVGIIVKLKHTTSAVNKVTRLTVEPPVYTKGDPKKYL